MSTDKQPRVREDQRTLAAAQQMYFYHRKASDCAALVGKPVQCSGHSYAELAELVEAREARSEKGTQHDI